MINERYMEISDDVKLGKNIHFFGYCNLYGCEIGDDCTIGPFVEIQKTAKLGRAVKVQSHSFICSGVTLEDEVFIGHGVMFTNDRFPRATTKDGKSKTDIDWKCENTLVSRRASIGSNSTILCGITIGEEAIIGAGSVVVDNVPARSIVAGNPAKVLRSLEDTDE